MPRAQRTKSAVHEALQRRAGNGPGDGFSGLLGARTLPDLTDRGPIEMPDTILRRRAIDNRPP